MNDKEYVDETLRLIENYYANSRPAYIHKKAAGGMFDTAEYNEKPRLDRLENEVAAMREILQRLIQEMRKKKE